METMSHTTRLPVASADQVRASRDELLGLAERHGLSRLHVDVVSDDVLDDGRRCRALSGSPL